MYNVVALSARIFFGINELLALDLYSRQIKTFVAYVDLPKQIVNDFHLCLGYPIPPTYHAAYDHNKVQCVTSKTESNT